MKTLSDYNPSDITVQINDQPQVWVVTCDKDPQPWENWSFPYQVVISDEKFVKKIVDDLNKNSKSLYEYKIVDKAEILHQK